MLENNMHSPAGIREVLIFITPKTMLHKLGNILIFLLILQPYKQGT